MFPRCPRWVPVLRSKRHLGGSCRLPSTPGLAALPCTGQGPTPGLGVCWRAARPESFRRSAHSRVPLGPLRRLIAPLLRWREGQLVVNGKDEGNLKEWNSHASQGSRIEAQAAEDRAWCDENLGEGSIPPVRSLGPPSVLCIRLPTPPKAGSSRAACGSPGEDRHSDGLASCRSGEGLPAPAGGSDSRAVGLVDGDGGVCSEAVGSQGPFGLVKVSCPHCGGGIDWQLCLPLNPEPFYPLAGACSCSASWRAKVVVYDP